MNSDSNQKFNTKNLSNVFPTHWTTLKIYALYRVLISILLVMLGYLDEEASIAQAMPLFYQMVSYGYLLYTLLTFILLLQIETDSPLATFTIVASDIFIITMLVHASGGLTSDLAILLVVAVAAGSIMIKGQAGILLAAIATIAVLFEQFFFSLKAASYNLIANAGFLGIAFFAISIFSQIIAQQLRESEALATRYEENLVEWQKLSHLIIQRMRTGIIVLSNKGEILLYNKTGQRLLQLSDDSQKMKPLASISPLLHQEFTEWQNNHEMPPKTFHISESGPAVRCDFTELAEKHKESRILVFIEDASKLTQQAQQIKLASLATLTAGIAHEIRNPLGAISHAAQLLQESESLDQQDCQLANIIQQHSVRMNNIIENVLYLSRRKKPLPKVFNLVEWLNSFLTSFRESYSGECAFNVMIQTEQEVNVNIDPSQLFQVVTNLVDNGLRYSLKGIGNATLNIIVDFEGDLPTLLIRDFGPGIEEEHLGQLFVPFFTTETKGTGLGLYLARELCEINHTHLGIKPCEGRGSCFQIIFPHPKKRFENKEEGYE